jgi:hypothetical protein
MPSIGTLTMKMSMDSAAFAGSLELMESRA